MANIFRAPPVFFIVKHDNCHWIWIKIINNFGNSVFCIAPRRIQDFHQHNPPLRGSFLMDGRKVQTAYFNHIATLVLSVSSGFVFGWHIKRKFNHFPALGVQKLSLLLCAILGRVQTAYFPAILAHFIPHNGTKHRSGQSTIHNVLSIRCLDARLT